MRRILIHVGPSVIKVESNGSPLTRRSTHEAMPRIPNNKPEIPGPSKVHPSHDVVCSLSQDGILRQEADGARIRASRWRTGLSCSSIRLASVVAPKRYHGDGWLVGSIFKLACPRSLLDIRYTKYARPTGISPLRSYLRALGRVLGRDSFEAIVAHSTGRDGPDEPAAHGAVEGGPFGVGWPARVSRIALAPGPASVTGLDFLSSLQ